MDTERRLVTLSDGRDIDLLLAGPVHGLPSCPVRLARPRVSRTGS